MGRGSSGIGANTTSGSGLNGKPNDATEYYVSGDGMWINQFLRGEDGFGELSESEKQYLKDLDTATNGKITDEVLYRSVDAQAIFGSMSDSDYDNLRQLVLYGENAFGKGSYAESIKRDVKSRIGRAEGKTIPEKGFMSTTSEASVAEEWGGFSGSDKPIVMRMKTGKNTRGVNLSSYDKKVSADNAQHERLLARNQKYKVLKVYGKNGHIYVDVILE